MNPECGYTRLYRRLWDNPVFRNKQEAGVFAWMISAARWKPAAVRSRIGPVALQAGEVLTSERQLAADFGMHRNTLRGLIHRMIGAGMIAPREDQERTASGTIYQIVKYQEYQSVNGAFDLASGPVPGPDAVPVPGPDQDQTRTSHIEKEGNQGKEDSPSGESREDAPAREAPPPLPPDRDVIPFPAAASPPIRSRKNGSGPRATPIAPDWQPDSQDRGYADSLGHDDDWIDREAEAFRDRCLRDQDKARYSDWHAAWRTWVRNAERFAARDYRSAGFAGRFAEKPGEITAAMHAVLNRRHLG